MVGRSDLRDRGGTEGEEDPLEGACRREADESPEFCAVRDESVSRSIFSL